MAETIAGVLNELDEAIEWAREQESRLGYFPALYRKVTVEVERGIHGGFFDDPARMERLDVLFANRYLDAFHAFRRGESPTASWAFAFARAASWRPTVLQHLLLGMNAHINLDLGIAAARTAPGDALADLRADFARINQVLAALIEDVQADLSQVWPGLGLLLHVIRRSDDVIVNFSMTRARDAAWRVAETLAPLEAADQDGVIDALDRRVTGIGQLVDRPGVMTAATLTAIRLRERGSVAEIIDILR